MAVSARIGMFAPPGLLEHGPETARAFLARAEKEGIDHVCCGDHVSFVAGLGFDASAGRPACSSTWARRPEIAVCRSSLPAAARAGLGQQQLGRGQRPGRERPFCRVEQDPRRPQRLAALGQQPPGPQHPDRHRDRRQPAAPRPPTAGTAAYGQIRKALFPVIAADGNPSPSASTSCSAAHRCNASATSPLPTAAPSSSPSHRPPAPQPRGATGCRPPPAKPAP